MTPVSVGVDLGGTNARAAVVDADTGEIVAAHKAPLRDRSPERVVEVVRHAVDSAVAAAGVDLAACPEVGVGVAAQILGATGVILNAPNLGWRDVQFGALLEAALGRKVLLANDLAVAAWGEKKFGAAKGLDDVILVFVGSGVGSGQILGGRMHRGAHGVAGEFGHIKVRPTRPETRLRRCGCGEIGCLESFVSGMNVAARVREEIAAGAHTVIPELVGGDLARVNATAVDAAYGAGDAYAVGLWNEVGEILGVALANYVTILNPAKLILGGGVLLGCPNLAALVRRHMDDQISRSALRGFSVEGAALGDDAGVIGAALLGQP